MTKREFNNYLDELTLETGFDLTKEQKAFAYQAAKKYHEQTLRILRIQEVVGQSEQYHCELYDFGRKDKPCDKQCDGCKAMNLD